MSSNYSAGVDLLELASNNTQLATDSAVEQVRAKAASIEAGQAGECEYCERKVPRVVKCSPFVGRSPMLLCGRCRDELKVG